MFFFSSRRRHTRYWRDWSSDVCSSDLNLKQLVASEPWQVRYVLRVLPVQVVVPTRLDTIKQGARNLVKKMGNDTFRVTVEKRHNNSLGSMQDRKSTRLNSSHANISYAVFCLKKK